MKAYDAIVVLGVSTHKRDFAKRVETAVTCYEEGASSCIIFSGRYWGGLKKKPSITEARAMANYARELGVPQKDIYLEERSLNTMGNFYFMKMRVLRPRKFRRLLVVTKQSHIPKTTYLSQKILGKQYRCTVITDADAKNDHKNNHSPLHDTKIFFRGIKDGDDRAIKNLLVKHKYYLRYKKFS